MNDDIQEMPNKALLEETALKLQREFWSHLAEVRLEIPDANPRGVFEAWAIQRLANYEVIILQLAEVVSQQGIHLQKMNRRLVKLQNKEMDFEDDDPDL